MSWDVPAIHVKISWNNLMEYEWLNEYEETSVIFIEKLKIKEKNQVHTIISTFY